MRLKKSSKVLSIRISNLKDFHHHQKYYQLKK